MYIISKTKKIKWWYNRKKFLLNNKEYTLFCHYHCGWPPYRMTERSVELPVADEWLSKHSDVYEVGAVTPYFWPSRIKNIIDPSDKHKAVNIKRSLFDISFEGLDILSISTVEHVGNGEYGLPKEPSLAPKALEKILNEAKNALITLPVGYNKELDNYIFNHKKDNIRISYLARGKGIMDNDWKQINFPEGFQLNYGPRTANTVIFIEK